MTKKALPLYLLVFALILVGTTYYAHYERNKPQKEPDDILWGDQCSGLVEYRVLNESSLPVEGWSERDGVLMRVENGSVFLKIPEVSSLELSGCSLLDGKLYLKFTCSKEKRATSTSLPWGEETTAYLPVLGRAPVLRIVPKAEASGIVVYLRGGINSSVTIPWG
ncbi:MAG: hypothetical protein PWP49_493 [Thermococcaceae archaeon]|jgi:hypothetical protein|uniref:hypothetical protein n=1 Tax=Thermococcus TaxID=2263 RepID=UPI0005B254F3|nr:MULTISPECIES: hypothetical protein [Thermococcus]MCA6214644.1 hypothetical protein [Thermococcus bergensis]MDK2982804.1 hypothetical protein [Thermococcaceae archaeon]MDN5320073.1 hypothetical protein [Thermococcaceae archaeon]MPW38701.1 hypothetical protein [Thermococcus sp. 101 C5]